MTSGAACGDVHCITCSDEGVPMRALEASADGLVSCLDATGSASVVMTELVGAVAAGDELLVHAGVALARLDEKGRA